MKLTCGVLSEDLKLSTFISDLIKVNDNLVFSNIFRDLDLFLTAASDVDIIIFDMNNVSIDLSAILGRIDYYKFLIIIVDDSHSSLYQSHIQTDIEYLFQPIGAMQFNSTINRIRQKYWAQRINESLKVDYFFFDNANDEMEQIKCNFNEITVIEVEDKRLKIHTLRGLFETMMPISRIQSQLEVTGYFIRVHRSFIVAKEHIQSVRGRELKVLNYKNKIKIGITYYKPFTEYINLKLVK